MSGDQKQSPDQQADTFVGTVIAGKYEVKRVLGKGNMGAVYLGRHTAMDAAVAIKLLHSNIGANVRAAERFVNEAKACSRLYHPNTIRVMDFGQMEGGELYLVMELLDGEDLKDVLSKTGPLEPARAIAITRQIAQSLDEAHAVGIVHRDLKPANVFLTKMHRRDDFVKVIDFGISKAYTADSEGVDLTLDGTVLGTPLYMSPEQIHGKSLDRRSDLYSLGVMLYQMLAGKPPFWGKTTTGLLMAHAHEPPPPLPSTVGDRTIPLALRQLVANLLAKDRDDRLQSAAELDDVLERFETALLKGEEPQFVRASAPTQDAQATDMFPAELGEEKTVALSPTAGPRPAAPPPVVDAATVAFSVEGAPTPGGPTDSATVSAASLATGARSETAAGGRRRLPLFVGGGVLGVAAVVAIILFATRGGAPPDEPSAPKGAEEAPLTAAAPSSASAEPAPAGLAEDRPAQPAPAEKAAAPGPKTPDTAAAVAAASAEKATEEAPAPPAPRKYEPGEVVSPEGTRGSEMAYVPGNTFDMGAGENAVATEVDHCREVTGRPVCTTETFADQIPPRRLRVASLFVDRLEAHNADYRACVEAGACAKRDVASCGTLAPNGSFAPDPKVTEEALSEDDLPVSCVTRAEAAAFCAWAGKRLPTEAEWEHAASSGGTRLYPWGDELDDEGERHNGADRALLKAIGRDLRVFTLNADDGHAFAAPVGQYPTGHSEHGLLDLAGNVAEWTAGDYDAYSGAPLPDDAQGKAVARGGSWADIGPFVGTRARRALPVDTRRTDLGLRCVFESAR